MDKKLKMRKILIGLSGAILLLVAIRIINPDAFVFGSSGEARASWPKVYLPGEVDRTDKKISDTVKVMITRTMRVFTEAAEQSQTNIRHVWEENWTAGNDSSLHIKVSPKWSKDKLKGWFGPMAVDEMIHQVPITKVAKNVNLEEINGLENFHAKVTDRATLILTDAYRKYVRKIFKFEDAQNQMRREWLLTHLVMGANFGKNTPLMEPFKKRVDVLEKISINGDSLKMKSITGQERPHPDVCGGNAAAAVKLEYQVKMPADTLLPHNSREFWQFRFALLKKKGMPDKPAMIAHQDKWQHFVADSTVSQVEHLVQMRPDRGWLCGEEKVAHHVIYVRDTLTQQVDSVRAKTSLYLKYQYEE